MGPRWGRETCPCRGKLLGKTSRGGWLKRQRRDPDTLDFCVAHCSCSSGSSRRWKALPAPARPQLELNRIYRTKQFARWGKNPARLVHRMVKEGQLHELAHGLYYVPTKTRFGVVPPSQGELLGGFLETDDFVVTGPPAWNALGLGATAMFAVTLVYNKKRSGKFALGNQEFLLRRVAFPEQPSPEWFAIDLIEHQAMAGVTYNVLQHHLQGRYVAGVYAMSPDDTCALMAADFDDADWQGDVLAFATAGRCKGIDVAFERSRSGNGAHA